MKPREKKPEVVFRIIDRATGEVQGSYSRACHDEYDFGGVEEARRANCHGVFDDRTKFAIAKYRVTYTLIDPDVEEERGDRFWEEALRGDIEKAYKSGNPWAPRSKAIN